MARRANAIKRAIDAIKRSHAGYVNLRFADLIGRWHQVTVPISNFGPHTFDRGVAFDGSSVAGFTRLESGDLRLIPDPETYFIEEGDSTRSASFICNCVEVDTGKPFSRDPRLVVEKAERFLVTTGIADKAFFMPELEFNLLDDVEVLGLPHATGYAITSGEAGLVPSSYSRHFPWLIDKAGYHAMPPGDKFWALRCSMVSAMEQAGIPVKYSHHEVGSAGQCEIEIRPNTPRLTGDHILIAKYLIKIAAAREGVVATFIPKPLHGQPGNGMHFHQHLIKRGRNIFFRKGGYGNLSKIALNYIGGLLRHGRSLLAFTCASTNSYRRLVPGFEAPTCFVYGVGNRSAAVRIPKGLALAREARVEFRPSDASGNPYLSMAAMLLAGIDGIIQGIDPEEEGFGPYDLNVFGLNDMESRGIQPVPFSLQEALEALREDHEFLLRRDVFTRDLIETWIDIKTKEVREISRHPHPIEIQLYLDC